MEHSERWRRAVYLAGQALMAARCGRQVVAVTLGDTSRLGRLLHCPCESEARLHAVRNDLLIALSGQAAQHVLLEDGELHAEDEQQARAAAELLSGLEYDEVDAAEIEYAERARRILGEVDYQLATMANLILTFDARARQIVEAANLEALPSTEISEDDIEPADLGGKSESVAEGAERG